MVNNMWLSCMIMEMCASVSANWIWLLAKPLWTHYLMHDKFPHLTCLLMVVATKPRWKLFPWVVWNECLAVGVKMISNLTLREKKMGDNNRWQKGRKRRECCNSNSTLLQANYYDGTLWRDALMLSLTLGTRTCSYPSALSPGSITPVIEFSGWCLVLNGTD